jgi:hypothetical protein
MKHLIISTFFCYLAIVPLFCYGEEQAKPLIGYGSSDAVLPAKNQELFYMGFSLGFQNTVKNKNSTSLVSTKQISDNSQLGAIQSVNQLIEDGVKVLVGFPTSHEALLVGKLVKDKGILTIFCGAGHSDLGTFGHSVYTTGESMSYGVDKMMEFISENFKGKKGAIISNPYAVFSKTLTETI